MSGYNPDDEDREDEVEDIFDPKVKGRVDPVFRLSKQLERCNILLGTAEPHVFNNSILGLLGDLPIGTKNKVLARQEEYNSVIKNWKYQENCGVQIGTPENPFVIVKDHPEWDFLMDVPRPFQDKYPDHISRQSPTPEEYEETDYIKLFEVCKEELEKSGGSWQYDKQTAPMMKVQETLPPEMVTEIVKNRTDFLMELRRKYRTNKIGYRDMNVGWDAAPRTPALNFDEDDK